MANAAHRKSDRFYSHTESVVYINPTYNVRHKFSINSEQYKKMCIKRKTIIQRPVCDKCLKVLRKGDIRRINYCKECSNE